MSFRMSQAADHKEQSLLFNESGYDALYPHFHIVRQKSKEYSDAYAQYRLLWKKAAQEHIVTLFPLHLDIEVTSHCNLHCPMCSRTHLIRKGIWKDEHMSFELFKRIVDEGAALGLCAINLNNFGESLLNKDIVQMVRYAKEKNILDVMLHTNGTMLTDALSEQLILSGLDTIVFSIDSITKEIYEKIRIGATFENVICNVRQFSTIRKKLKRQTPYIRVSMVRMKINAHEINKYEAFWGNDVDCISYADYRNQNAQDNEDRYVSEKDKKASYMCPSLWQRMTVNASGEVTACCRDAEKRLVLGDISNRETTLQSIWEGSILKNARQLHLSGKGGELDACFGCDHIRGNQR